MRMRTGVSQDHREGVVGEGAGETAGDGAGQQGHDNSKVWGGPTLEQHSTTGILLACMSCFASHAYDVLPRLCAQHSAAA